MLEAKSYLTVGQVLKKYPAFKESFIRSAIFNRDRNGFNVVVRKLVRKILIDEAEFVAWIERGGK